MTKFALYNSKIKKRSISGKIRKGGYTVKIKFSSKYKKICNNSNENVYYLLKSRKCPRKSHYLLLREPFLFKITPLLLNKNHCSLLIIKNTPLTFFPMYFDITCFSIYSHQYLPPFTVQCSTLKYFDDHLLQYPRRTAVNPIFYTFLSSLTFQLLF